MEGLLVALVIITMDTEPELNPGERPVITSTLSSLWQPKAAQLSLVTWVREFHHRVSLLL